MNKKRKNLLLRKKHSNGDFWKTIFCQNSSHRKSRYDKLTFQNLNEFVKQCDSQFIQKGFGNIYAPLETASVSPKGNHKIL